MRIIRKLFNLGKPSAANVSEAVDATDKKFTNSWSTHAFDGISGKRSDVLNSALKKTFQRESPKAVTVPGGAMDVALDGTGLAGAMNTGTMDSAVGLSTINYGTTVSDVLLAWYASQGFIGYQTCAVISQHWLVAKACLMPAKDAIRNGYKITKNDGKDLEPDILSAIQKADQEYCLNKNMVELVSMGRVFGIRIALFIVQSDDPNYYLNPFNIDGVKEGSYKGITQIDPYWITPMLDNEAAANPASPYFYEPTWWRVNGSLIHRTHLIIFRTEEVPDILKTSYFYGGVSIPQKIYERVYAAERTANEAPMLAMTKRTDVIKVDLEAAAAEEGGIRESLEAWRMTRDNYGVKVLGHPDDYIHAETSLADLDTVIMTQYQIVAAIANVPAAKLLGTSPKGFNATGEFEEASYHEELRSIQAHDLTPLLERHHLLLLKSAFGDQTFETTVTWNPLDEMTAEELANVNKLKAETGQVLAQSGAIDGQDERDRITKDPESGYDGLSGAAPEPEPENNEDLSDNEEETALNAE